MRQLLTLILFLVSMHTLWGQSRHDTFLQVATNDSLDATYFIPTSAPPANGYPAIVFVHGYGMDKFATMSSCSSFASSGYATLCYSVRGHGFSSGGSTIMSVRERDDFGRVVSFLRALPNVDTSHIGVSGGSQGGLHGLWAAADRLPVAAITADVIVPRWASDMLMNGCFRRTLVLLHNGSAVRYDSERDSLWELLRTNQYDAFRQKFASPRDVDTAALEASSAPMLTFLKWQDHYFTAADGIASFPRSAAQKKIYVGTRGHFSDQAESERTYQHDQVSRWFNYFLRGVSNGITSESTYTYAYSRLPMDTAGFFTWTRVGTSEWPPPEASPVRMYLTGDSTLSFTPAVAISDSFEVKNEYVNPSYTFDDGYIEGFRGPRFENALLKSTSVFISPALTSEVLWAGVSYMSLNLRSNDSEFPIHLQIYEMDSLGNKYFINRINYTARNWVPGSAGSIEVHGIAHAHKFQSGNRLRVEVTNIDVTNRLLYGSYPFVLPLFANSSATLFTDISRPSYIELPLVGTPTAVLPEAPPLPTTLELLQNYPNPFNPVTRISYTIRHAAVISLKVFNSLGQEVKSLVHGYRTSGHHEVVFDASSFASGVYKAVLTDGTTTTSKSLLLVR